MRITGNLSWKAEKNIVDKLTAISGSKGREMLKKAINEVGKDTSKNMIEGAVQRYVRQKKSGFKQSMKEKKATNGNPSYTITSNGKSKEIVDFRVTPKQPAYMYKRKAKAVRGQALKSSSLGSLDKYGNKAFIVQFKSGHVAAVVRVPGKKYTKPAETYMREHKKLDLTKIEPIRSVNAPTMLGKIYSFQETDTVYALKDALRRHIEERLG